MLQQRADFREAMGEPDTPSSRTGLSVPLTRETNVIGAFALFYGLARAFCEFFREPDPQLGFLWGGLTMGMLLSLPMILGGVLIIWLVLRAPARA